VQVLPQLFQVGLHLLSPKTLPVWQELREQAGVHLLPSGDAEQIQVGGIFGLNYPIYYALKRYLANVLVTPGNRPLFDTNVFQLYE